MLQQDPLIHVRFEGRSWTIPASTLALSVAAPDEEVKAALAGHLDIALEALAPYVVERHANGNLTVRPAAVFG
jgi:hypothetical protein